MRMNFGTNTQSKIGMDAFHGLQWLKQAQYALLVLKAGAEGGSDKAQAPSAAANHAEHDQAALD